MPRAFYQMMFDHVLSMMGGRLGVHTTWEQVERMAEAFTNQGGSWYRLAHGNPADLALLKALALEALRYESRKEQKDA